MVKIRIKKQLKEISKREQELKDKGIDPDLVGIPREFKRLAAGIMEDELTEKEKKKNCQAGNPRHNADGEFASQDDNTSWSLSKPSGASNCTAGQSRMDKGSNKRKITKKDKRTKRCGRDKAKGTSKSRYRCKDGSRVWENQDTEPKRIRVRIRKSMVLAAPKTWLHEDKDLDRELDDLDQNRAPKEVSQGPEKSDDSFIGVQAKYMEFINSLTKEERIQVRNLFCYDRFSIKQWNDIHKASDGKLNEPPK